jgi:copper chaperone CopZ
MRKKILLILVLFLFFGASAQQVNKVSLQASGLTCSLCSNAINKALKSLDFVAKVDANIKNSSFEIYFKPDADVDLDKLRMKVEEAGFSVASFLVSMHFNAVKLLDDHCMVIGETAFRFINTREQSLDGDKVFRVLDKGFVPTKEFKKNGAELSKGQCYERVGQKTTKFYHVTI